MYISFYGSVQDHSFDQDWWQWQRDKLPHDECGYLYPWPWCGFKLIEEEIFGQWSVCFWRHADLPEDCVLVTSGNEPRNYTSANGMAVWPIVPTGQPPAVPVDTEIGLY